ncbi:MAG: hypothetical protein M1268_02455 [Patescibacteria group bacterium]|nr:hypothetical protein [Patescibacteria group bacterium]
MNNVTTREQKNAGPRYLLASDFDGTLFNTFWPSPNNMDVRKAYELATNAIFGWYGSHIYDLFSETNDTPSEVVAKIFRIFSPKNYLYEWQKEDNIRVTGEIIESAHNFYLANWQELQPYLSEAERDGKTWTHESMTNIMTRMLVAQKLKYLVSEIGNKNGDAWPQPCEGVLYFFERFKALKKEGMPIDFAVISSGHDLFIKKTFDLWGLPHPDVMVTEDDIRIRIYPKEIERRFKPGMLPLALTHYKWLRQQGLAPENDNFITNAQETRQRMIYIGDDIGKDLTMGFHGKIDHTYLYPNTPWEAVIDTLEQRKDLLDGRPLSDIFGTREHGKETDVLLPDNLEARYRPAWAKER